MNSPREAVKHGGLQHARSNPTPKEAAPAQSTPADTAPPKPARTTKPKPTAPQRVEPLGQPRVRKSVLKNISSFLVRPTGLLKLLRMFLTIGAAIFFVISEAPESYIVITILEIGIIFLFTMIDMLALHQLMYCLDWPLFDLANNLITAVFLSVVGIVTVSQDRREPGFYIGGSLCIAVAVLSAIHAFLVSKKVTKKLRNLLCFEEKPKTFSSSLASSPSTLSMVPSEGSLRTLSRAPSQPPSEAPSFTSLLAPSVQGSKEAPHE